ncbi:MAG: MMPL family transporter, partial [Acidimicrobiales bacterium]
VILIAIVAFALSTDYELFLVSRIKEEYDITGDVDDSVVKGLGRSGRIISLAAILLALALAAFVTSNVTSVKEFGFGVAVAIILDAAVVRGILVPSLMSLAGKWNWWAPSPARALHSVVGIRHHHHHHHLRKH